MDKIPVVIILSTYGLVIGIVVGSFLLQPENQGNGWELNIEMMAIENITFKGTSGEVNNSLILNITNKHSRINVILEQVNVTGQGVNEIFSIIPEEKYFSSNSQGQVTLLDVGWTEGHEYKIELLSLKGNRFPIKVTA